MKTDNSFFQEKVNLRIDSLPKKQDITVLDCFSGTGSIWNAVKKSTKKQINVLSIEVIKGKNKTALCGDNIKYLQTLDLNKFDIIDLDAYGIPFTQMQILFQKGYKGIVHITAIQSGMGSLPYDLLYSLGYTDKMLQHIKSIFNRNGIDKLKNYLYLHGVQSIEGYFIDRKNYFYFTI